jgi:hypothetical protein
LARVSIGLNGCGRASRNFATQVVALSPDPLPRLRPALDLVWDVIAGVLLLVDQRTQTRGARRLALDPQLGPSYRTRPLCRDSSTRPERSSVTHVGHLLAARLKVVRSRGGRPPDSCARG